MRLSITAVAAGGAGLAAAAGGSGGVWQAVAPGGATACSHGTPYTFFVSPGTVNKLLVEFEGGGCCFDALTCATPIYTRSVDVKQHLTLTLIHTRSLAPRTSLS